MSESDAGQDSMAMANLGCLLVMVAGSCIASPVLVMLKVTGQASLSWHGVLSPWYAVGLMCAVMGMSALIEPKAQPEREGDRHAEG